MYFFSIPIGKGNSGGPVFNSQGKLVALIAFSRVGYNNLSAGPHIDRIKKLIRLNRDDDVTTLSSYQNLYDNDIENNRQVLSSIRELVIEIWND